jgi:hypothetical protein
MAMKIYRLFSALLAIIVIACLFEVQGQFQEQYVTPSSGYSTAAPSAAQNPLQYSQFYTRTTGSAPSNPIGAPQQFEIAGNMPSTVYLGEQMQSVPYSQYLSYPAYTGANSLWIRGATAWTQYAVVPQGATVSLFAISPTGGSGSLTFVDSDGQTYSHNYFFYPNSLLTFYADTIGRHTLSFAINGQASNIVVIDVVGGTYTQPSNNPENYPGYYPWDYSGYYPGYYPWDYSRYYPWDYCGAGYHQENGKCVPDQVNPGGEHRIEIRGGDTNTGGNPGNAPSITPVNPSTNVPSTNPSGEHRVEIRGGETHTSGNPGGDTNTGGNPGNAPSITPVNPSTNVPSTNPSGEHRVEIRGGETHTSGNPGGDNNQCDAGYHLEP